MAFAILQRTQTLGILRTVGVSRREILGTILWETLGIAAIATALGLALGHVLAIGLVDLVLRTPEAGPLGPLPYPPAPPTPPHQG